MSSTGLRALALAATVGLAAVGVWLGASGTAVAAAGNVAVSPDPVNGSTTVTVTARADTPGNDLTVAVDGDGDGTIQASEALGTNSTNGTTGNGSVSGALGSMVAGEGSRTVYVVEESSADGVDDTTYPVADTAAFYDATATVEVDDTAPTVSAFSVANPSGRSVEVTFNASERVVDVAVAIDGPDAGRLTEIGFVSTGGGPYAYEATYEPATDGEYAVTLDRAADAAGNDGAAGESATALAAVAGRDESTVFDASSPVFLGETAVDVSPVVGDGTATFRPLGGARGSGAVRANASALPVTSSAGFVPGRYDATGDGEADLVVRAPTVDGPTLVLGNASGNVAVTDGYVQAGDLVTVTASFRFGTADDLSVSVVDPMGLDVAPSMTTDPVLADGADAVRLDTAGLETGTYTVSVSAERLQANASATFELVRRDRSVSLDRTRVVRGRDVTATVFGPPGHTATVRLPRDALANRSTIAAELFESTGDVRNRSGSADAVGVELVLGRDGIGRVRFDTAYLAAGRTAIDALSGSIAGLDGSAVDDVRLDVTERTVSLREPPGTAAIGETVTVAGEAPQVEAVAAYARVGDTWYPVVGDEWARTTVRANGTFDLEVPVDGELAQPGTYQVAVVAVPDPPADPFRADEPLSRATVAGRPRQVFTLDTRVGSALGGAGQSGG